MYMTMDLSPIIISLKTATLSIIITFFLGVAAAQFVFRLKSKTMKTILDGLFTLPLVLPPTVAGFFLLYIFGMRRPIKCKNCSGNNSWPCNRHLHFPENVPLAHSKCSSCRKHVRIYLLKGSSC